MAKSIVLIGAFDTKQAEYSYLRQLLLDRGATVVAVDTGVMAHDGGFPIDVHASEVAEAGGGDLAALRRNNDRA